MNRQELMQHYRLRIVSAHQQQQFWKTKIDDAPTSTTPHQIGVWRGKVRDWIHQEKALQERIEQLKQD